VIVYPSLDEAIHAGFRLCKRCQPERLGKMNPDSLIAHDVKTFLLRNYKQPITLEDISREILISPYHLQRVFKRIIGITPHQFLLQK
jgi:AraC family transcriptional regulator of adaptative response / methylphosphotriester-DNA alkyltransferase methyltransferase